MVFIIYNALLALGSSVFLAGATAMARDKRDEPKKSQEIAVKNAVDQILKNLSS